MERYVQIIKQTIRVEKQIKKLIDEKINDFLMSYQINDNQLFIGTNISTKIDLIKPPRLIVKKKSHDVNEIRSFSSKDNAIVQFFGGNEHWKKGKILKKLSCKMYLVSVDGKC